MADRIQGITVEIGGDTTGLSNALKDINKESSSLSKELKDVEKLLKLDPTNTELLAQKQELLAKQAETAAKRVDAVHQAQDQFNRMVAEGKIEKGTEEYRKFEREVASAEASLKKAEEAQEEFGKKSSAISKVRDAVAGVKGKLDELKDSKFGQAVSAGFDAIKSAAKATVEAVAAVGAAVVGFAKDSVKAGQEFDASMSQVAAVSGATGDNFDALREKALEMGSKTKFSASEAADAMNYMAMAGWKTEDMLGGIEGIMNLAAASGESLAATSDIVTDALTAFGLSAADSGHFADILAAASSNANTNVGMMGETFKYVAPIAGAMGFSAEDTAEAIGLMANAGIKASTAGTSLRSIMTALTSEVDLSCEALGDYVVETQNSDGTMRDLSDILADLRQGFSGLSEAEAAQHAQAIVGKNAMSGFLALMNAAPEDVEKLSSAIEHCSDETEAYTGEAERMAQVMQDNLAGDITIFKSALEGAQITLSDALTPSLREFVQFGTEGLAELTKAFNEGGLSGLVDALNEVLEDGINLLMEQIPKFVEAGLQILTALANGIQNNKEMLIETAGTLVQTIASSIVELFPVILELGISLFTTLIGALPEIIKQICAAIPQIITAIVDALLSDEMINQIIESGVELLIALVENLPQIIKTIISAIPKIITALYNAFTDKENLKRLAEAGSDLIKGLWEGIKDMGAWIKEKIGGFASGIVDSIKDFFGIHSPSKVFRDEIGRMLALGVGEGFAEEMKAVRDEMQDEIPTDFSTEVNTAFGAANAMGGDVFDVTIPFMIGADKITTQVSRIQYNRQTGQARVMGVTTA